MRLLKLTCITITFVLALITMMCSCLPRTLIYKPTDKSWIINDSISVKLGEGRLNYKGIFYYSIQLDMMNKSNSLLYFDYKLGSMESDFENRITPFEFSGLSDSILYPHSEKRFYLGFRGEDDLLVPNFFKNRKMLKNQHHFNINLYMHIGDSVVMKNVKYTPK